MPILILLLYIILNPMCSDDVKKQRLWLLCTCRFYFAVIHLQFFYVRYTLQEPLQCRIWECTSNNTVRGSAHYEYRMFEISLGWKCKSSGMKCHVGGWVVASVAKDHCLHLQGHNWSNLRWRHNDPLKFWGLLTQWHQRCTQEFCLEGVQQIQLRTERTGIWGW